MNEVVFNASMPLAETLPVQVLFNAPFQVVDVKLHKPGNYGLSAGREGLGCQFFSEANGTLYSLLLDMNPYGLVDTAPMSLLKPLSDHIRAQAAPGVLTLKTFPDIALMADAIWLYEPFGSALWSFDNLVIEPTDIFLESSVHIQYVEVGQGVIIGIRRNTNVLHCVFIERFEQHQWVLGTSISHNSHDASFIEHLNFIHWNYYADPVLSPDVPNPIEGLLLDPLLPDLLRNLIGRYIDELNLLPNQEDEGHDENSS